MSVCQDKPMPGSEAALAAEIADLKARLTAVEAALPDSPMAAAGEPLDAAVRRLRQRAERAEARLSLAERVVEALYAVTVHWADYDESEWGPEDPLGVKILSRARAALAAWKGEP